MAALTGGETCVKHLMFAFNLIFWVSLPSEDAYLLFTLGGRALRASFALRVGLESQETLGLRAFTAGS